VKDALVVVAAGESQLPLVRAALARDLAVLAVDRDPRAAALALEGVVHVEASTHDAEEALAALAPFLEDHRAVGVVTKSSGPPVATTAELARELGLAGVEPEFARLSASKPGTKVLARRRNVVTPGVTNRPPFVVKPAVTRVGKQAITLIDEARTGRLPSALRSAFLSSYNGDWEIEEYVPGQDVVLCALFCSDRLYPIALIDEDSGFDSDGIAVGLGFTLPSEYTGSPWESLVTEAASRLIEGAGTGIGFFTFRVPSVGPVRTPEHPVLIEVHLDLGGDHLVDKLFPFAGGIDPIAATLDLLIQGKVPDALGKAVEPSVMRFLFDADRLSQPGRLEQLKNLGSVDLGDHSRAHAVESHPRAGRAGARIGFVLGRPSVGEGPTAFVARVDSVLGRDPVAGATRVA